MIVKEGVVYHIKFKGIMRDKLRSYLKSRLEKGMALILDENSIFCKTFSLGSFDKEFLERIIIFDSQNFWEYEGNMLKASLMLNSGRFSIILAVGLIDQYYIELSKVKSKKWAYINRHLNFQLATLKYYAYTYSIPVFLATFAEKNITPSSPAGKIIPYWTLNMEVKAR